MVKAKFWLITDIGTKANLAESLFHIVDYRRSISLAKLKRRLIGELTIHISPQ